MSVFQNIILALAILAPLSVALVGIRNGAVSWTFLTFFACAQAAVLLLVAWPLAVIVWLIAWGCAIAARSRKRGPAGEATLSKFFIS
jgi:hypothetical protein